MRRFVLAASMALAAAQALAQVQPTYQGLWWGAPAGSESGWGLNLAHQGNILFATWFTYDADGRGMWLVVPRAELLPDDSSDRAPYGYPMGRSKFEYAGTLYRTRGPAFDAASFDASAVTVTAVGEATLAFIGADSGTFRYSVNGVSQSKAIVRQVFSSMPACAFGGPPGDFNDLWWRAPAGSESGWGLNVTQQGGIVFATWFTYDASGEGLWLVLPSATRTAANTFTGTLYRTSGPPFSSPRWDPARVRVDPVGTATLAFSDAANGTFTATVDGTTISKPITRQVFASPTTVCR